MTLSPATALLSGLIILLIGVGIVVFWSLRRSHGPGSTAGPPPDIAPWVLEGRRLFSLWEERVEQLDELKSRLSGMAQEIEQLRAELGQIDAMQAQIARLGEEAEQRRRERDQLREILGRIASLAQDAAVEPRSLEPPEAR